jgi:hypothetical protein
VITNYQSNKLVAWEDTGGDAGSQSASKHVSDHINYSIVVMKPWRVLMDMGLFALIV